MSVFSSIPVRSNADTGLVDASWWNAIRTALIAYAGTATVDETQSTISGTQSSYQSIGLTLDHSVTRAQQIEYTIYRDDGTVSRREMGTLHAMYKAREGTWYYERESHGDDALGNGTVSDPLIVNASGAFQYKSDNFASGTIRYKSVVTFSKET
jgi:hypothetical protein